MRSDVEVKKLVWSFSDNSVFCQWRAANCYCIKDTGSFWDHDRFWLRVAGRQAGKFATLEAAKAVAQADHEARVLAQPEPMEKRLDTGADIVRAMLAAAPSPEGKP